MRLLTVLVLSFGLVGCSGLEFFPKDTGRAKADLDGLCTKDCIAPIVKISF